MRSQDTFTAVTCLICFFLGLAVWAFVMIPLAVHWVHVILIFWGFKK